MGRQSVHIKCKRCSVLLEKQAAANLFVNIELPEYLRGVKEMLIFKNSGKGQHGYPVRADS